MPDESIDLIMTAKFTSLSQNDSPHPSDDSPKTYDDDGNEVTIKPRLEYSNSTVDKMLVGNYSYSASQIKFINSLRDENADFIKSWFWRYLPFPLDSIFIVPDILESEYNGIVKSNPSYIKGKNQFIFDFLRCDTHTIFARFLNNEYKMYFNMTYSYHSLTESTDLLEK